jgi:hypothetical protein
LLSTAVGLGKLAARVRIGSSGSPPSQPVPPHPVHNFRAQIWFQP